MFLIEWEWIEKSPKMKKICFILISFLLFLSLAFFIIPASSMATDMAKEKQQNILLITIDTLRADRLSCYSTQHVQTPNIDALAEKGVLFCEPLPTHPQPCPPMPISFWEFLPFIMVFTII